MKLGNAESLELGGESTNTSWISDILTNLLLDKSAMHIEMIQHIMDIPYARVNNDEIKQYLLASAKELQELWKVFYMNSCVPRTLLLIDEMREQWRYDNAELLLDFYIPIRDDYQAWSSDNNPTIHAAVHIPNQEWSQTIQFFTRKRIITHWAYENPEPNIHRILAEPITIPIKKISSEDSIQDVLDMWPIDDDSYASLLQQFNQLIWWVVHRLQESNTQEEFQKPHNQAFVWWTPIYLR